MSRSTMRSAAVACLAAVILVPQLALASDALLTDERLIVSNSFGSSEESYEGTVTGGFTPCDAGPDTVFQANVAGSAYGPYAGTFTSTADVEIIGGLVDTFHVTFEIVSGATTVTGEAQYGGSGADGSCSLFDDEGTTYHRVSAGSRAGGGNAQLVLEYTADVTGPTGTTTDVGVLDASINFFCSDPSTLATCDPGSFALGFLGTTMPRSAAGDEGFASTGSEATPDDPIATTIENPAGGFVAITESNGTPPSGSGFTFLGRTMDIYAEQPASVEAPIRLTFVVDASALFDGDGNALDTETIQVLRDDQPASDCEGADAAIPDPCVLSRTVDGSTGDLTLVVLTSEASLWNVAAGGGTAPWPFEGFFGGVTMTGSNTANSGSAVRLIFSLGGDRGHDIFASGYPRSHEVSCATGLASGLDESTAQPGNSRYSFNAASGRYTYVWKTIKTWAKSCRVVELRFADGGPTVQARFDFPK